MISKALAHFRQTLRFRQLRSAGNVLGEGVWLARSATLRRVELARGVRIAGGTSVEHSTLGEYSAVGRGSKITHADIGRFCAISWDCTVNATNHPVDALAVSAFPYVPEMGGFVSVRTQTYQRVEIGSDVWIGANSVVMPGIRIGHGAVIGAGAVVTKDVPAFVIVAGVPARIVRYRFSEEVVRRLLALQWWNLDTEVIRQHIALFQGPLDTDKLDRLEVLCK